MKPHIHAAVIHAFADGADVEVRNVGGVWARCLFPDFDPRCEYRVKPAASKWPQTTMTISELGGIYTRTPTDRTLKEFANIILAHACETGALVPADKVREIEAKARAEGVKQGMIKQQQASQEAEFYRSQMPTVTYSLFDLWGRK